MDLRADIKLHNRFEVVATDAATGEEIRGKAENVVLNQFYSNMVADNSSKMGLDYTYVGSGTNAPTITDTALQAQLLSRANNGSWNKTQYKVGGTGILVYTGNITISTTELNGSAISEVGLGASGGLSTRAILQDANGNPLSIQKTNTMTVVVYATAFLQIPTTISGFKVVGNEILFEVEPNRINFFYRAKTIRMMSKRIGKSWDESAAPRESLMAAPFSYYQTTETIDNANKKRNYALANIPAGGANVGGIRSVMIDGQQIKTQGIEIPVPNDVVVQPVLTKEVVGAGDGSNTHFSTKFGWIRDNGTAKVFVNDVEQTSGVTVKYNRPPSLQGSYYLEKTGQTSSVGSPTYDNVSGGAIRRTKCDGRTGHWLTASDNPNGVFENVVKYAAMNTWYEIPLAYRNKRYWGCSDDYSLTLYNNTTVELEGDIQFDTPPASGATIAVTYQPDCIAKDDTRIINNLSYSLGF